MAVIDYANFDTMKAFWKNIMEKFALKTQIPTKISELENDSGFTAVTIDSALSTSSTNPVQNKVVNSALNDKVPTNRTVNGKALSENITLSASDVGADVSGTANSVINTHNTNTEAHNDIRELITGLTTRLNALANSDDTTLDQMAEVVAYIKDNRTLIESITTNKVNVTDIIDNLTTNVTDKPLSAAQGVAIKALIDALQAEVDKKALASDLTSHTGNTANPHGVTKVQVGLENVPNVSTNDQTPTYTASTTLSALTSGEKLSVAFGKLAKAVSDLINHLANTSNPHSVTKTQVGLGNVENKSSATIRGELTKENVTDALGYEPSGSDTVYTHPSYTAKSSGLYKITVDDLGHVSAVTAVTKDDITALGVPSQDTTYTLSSFGITATATELNYVDGVTSNVQTQLNDLNDKISTLTSELNALKVVLNDNTFLVANNP